MRDVLRVLAARPLTGYWKTKLTVAAVLLIAATVGIFWLSHSPQRAYGLDDLPNRLLEIKSIYMTGWLHTRSAAGATCRPQMSHGG